MSMEVEMQVDRPSSLNLASLLRHKHEAVITQPPADARSEECELLKKLCGGVVESTPPPVQAAPTSQLSPSLQPSAPAVVEVPPQLSATLLGEKYLLLDQVEGSSLCHCVNVHTQEQLVCKVVGREAGLLLSAHYRVDAHPHINCLHEVLVGDRFLYLLFPTSHGDLHSHVRLRKRVREPEARRLFRQIAETVRACHEQGIVLRDLKLRKFVFADTNRMLLKLESLEDAVVLDAAQDDLLQDKRGCPAYVSPEILRSHAQYSGRAADMWSLGVILYTMLVGRYPFNDSDHPSLFAKISRGHFVVPDCLSARARCLIRSLLRREPSERLSAEDVLLHPWLTHEETHEGPHRSDQTVPEFYVE